MANRNLKIKTVASLALLVMAVFLLAGCSDIFYIPGASYGYFIWEEDGRIFVEWSVDRKDTEFSGKITTDGEISSYSLKEWEEDSDIIKTGEKEIIFSSTLDGEDYSDGFSFTPDDYTYLEFDLKINDDYDLSRINAGGFLESPGDGVFRIEKGYFESVRMKPWYQKRPFSEFFYKLFANKYFTFLYLFILGVIIIEIMRITVIAGKSKKVLWVASSYVILAVAEACIYFVLKFLAG
jgi:hypothetical protein